MLTAPSGPMTARAAVGFAGDDGELRDSRLGVGEQQLGPVTDDAAMLLLGAGKEARNVFERDERNVEGIAEADEARGLDAGVDVENPGEIRRLIGHDAHRTAIQTGESYDDIARVVFLNFEEIAIIDNVLDGVFDVVG